MLLIFPGKEALEIFKKYLSNSKVEGKCYYE